MIELFVYALILLVSVVLTVQAVFTLGFMLYAWVRPERLEETSSPDAYLTPDLSFSAILPARHEEGVIGDTMHRVWGADYPKELLEVVVVCEKGDVGTIAEAERAVVEIGHPNVRVVTFEGGPINKPHGLNVALGETMNEVVTIFDAEDDVHSEIFHVVNTIMQRDGASILQAGVQLMNFDSNWYSIQNVLEYFFWFKSRLHLHARIGMIPLGGNTVFMRRHLIETVGGWDEKCLTEDADIGIRLSALGERIAVTYDAEHATREETPHSVASFIKQRTRWSQGFLQILRKGVWRRLSTRGQRLLAAYTLAYPFFHAVIAVLWVPAIIMMIAFKVPVALAMLSLLPLYALGFQFLVSLVGLFDFAKAYELRIRARDLVRFTLGFLPYQILLSIGALRAVYREMLGVTSWEKTAHLGAHRRPEKKPAYVGLRQVPDGKRTVVGHARRRPVGVPAPSPNGFLTPFQLPVEEARSRLGIQRGSITILGSKGDIFLVRPSEGMQKSA
jgi:glycosyltransferase XagB